VKRACIDTHALIWHATSPKRLGRAAARWLRDADAGRAQISIPAIVAIELTLLREAGRKVLGPEQVEVLLDAGPFVLEPLDRAHAREFARLETVADPFDRMIIAAARAMDLPLITADENVTASALVTTIWD
jgi:PIN domain nuclease of toxin-antitoxin system